MASLVWASPSAPSGRALRMARARAWQWPRSSCRSSWRKTFRVGWRQAVSPDWTTFFTSCRDRKVTALPSCAPSPVHSTAWFQQGLGSQGRGSQGRGLRWGVAFGGVAHRGQGLRVPSLGDSEDQSGGVSGLSKLLVSVAWWGVGGPSVPEPCLLLCDMEVEISLMGPLTEVQMRSMSKGVLQIIK